MSNEIEGQNVTVMKLNIYSVHASADRLLNLDSIVESSVYIEFNFWIDWKTFHLFQVSPFFFVKVQVVGINDESLYG